MDKDLTPAEKKKIYDELFRITFEQLKSKKLSIEEGQELAEFVLDNMELVKKKQDLLIFLEKLGRKWPFFNNYYLKNKGKHVIQEDERKIEEITAKLHNFIN